MAKSNPPTKPGGRPNQPANNPKPYKPQKPPPASHPNPTKDNPRH